jgi:very-short-patch-repair endonuclease
VTSLSARGRIPFEPGFVDLLVIDEASQCDIASVIPLLFRARRVVVIGDPKQLRHISQLSRPQDQQLLAKHDLLTDHPAWAYSTQSLFDLAVTRCRSSDIVVLRDHHRSHADIIGFSNSAFYDGALRVATRHDRLRRPSLSEPAVRWQDVRGRTVRPPNGGAMNEVEAAAVVAEIRRLVDQDYQGSIGVVSPFRAQATRIRDMVGQDERLSRRLASSDFLVDTVHKFQGDERDVMLFSPVVSQGASDSALQFLRGNGNLFNVAVTRARAALVVIGDQEAALNSNVDYLARFATHCDTVRRGAPSIADAGRTDFGPEYPVLGRSDRISEWERVFYRAAYAQGIKLIPQYPVDKYFLDFALIVGDRRLNIEIDGEHYHRDWDGELCRRDQIRNQRMIELGWDVMRFWVYQVRDGMEGCLGRVRGWSASPQRGD